MLCSKVTHFGIDSKMFSMASDIECRQVDFGNSLMHGPHPLLLQKRQAVRIVRLSLLNFVVAFVTIMCCLLQADHMDFAKEVVNIAHAACMLSVQAVTR